MTSGSPASGKRSSVHLRVKGDRGEQPQESAQDSEADGAILAEWVEARKLTTTRLRPGCDQEEVDVLLD